ncbi:SGNH/GDSL hydrolase family protein [Sphingomonas morindae]|uniref:GDSL-type esterase/lipase family protein n=1 Tax=Sphingomonas morindae TaxID=1541170 RepID=A0ABY4X7V7_9SPHN|nr:SGNH/GDSL hydrolase family protein [Sphingomonas morindae]USI73023.1 GDSL-type esterase/lipase family protein [Sphingomonas morindae]
MTRAWRLGALTAALAIAAAPAPKVAPAEAPPALRALPVVAEGRVVRGGDAAAPVFTRQWPGTAFETGFTGRRAFFRLGAGRVILVASVDGAEIARLTAPAPGLYAVTGLAEGRHRLRVAIVSESQAGPTRFEGFHAGPEARTAPLPAPARRIEFIGDSHTVGYANRSTTRQCDEATVWATTDTDAGLPGQLARLFGATYRVNAISGRGVVRNYNGFAADSLPKAYGKALFGADAPAADDRGWAPQVLVVALGTNDFTTALHAGERWPDRDALHREFEQSYGRFLAQLRARHPDALILVWATDMAEGEIEAEAGAVVRQRQAAGDRAIAFVPVDHLALSSCNQHPSLADDGRIAAALAAEIRARAGWRAPR